MGLRAICVYLTQCVSKLSSVILDLKVEQGSLKVSNDDFGANVARLKMMLKTN